MKKRLIIALILIAITVASLFLYRGIAEEADSPGGILRLHVVANSDSQEDQAVKLQVRDAVMPLVAQAASSGGEKDAENLLAPLLGDIKRTAEDILEDNALTYGVKADIGTYSFPAKSYGGRVYPAGEYRALNLVLGKGAGQNWWCVIFPPLCIADMEGVPITSDPSQVDVQYRSLLEQWWQEMFGK